jgi:hypothetical protein
MLGDPSYHKDSKVYQLVDSLSGGQTPFLPFLLKEKSVEIMEVCPLLLKDHIHMRNQILGNVSGHDQTLQGDSLYHHSGSVLIDHPNNCAMETTLSAFSYPLERKYVSYRLVLFSEITDLVPT